MITSQIINNQSSLQQIKSAYAYHSFVCLLVIFFYFFYIADRSNDALGLELISQRVHEDGFINGFGLNTIFIASLGELFGHHNIQKVIALLNISLIYIFGLKYNYTKFFSLIVASIIINPLLHPLISTVNRSFLTMIFALLFFHMVLESLSRSKGLIYCLFGVLIHPLEMLIDVIRILIASIGLQKRLLLIVFTLSLFAVLFDRYFDLSNLIKSKYDLYLNTTEYSSFSASKAAYIIFLNLLAFVIFYLRKTPLNRLGLISALSIFPFWGFGYIERFWLFPTLIISISLLNFFSLRACSVFSAVGFLLYVGLG